MNLDVLTQLVTDKRKYIENLIQIIDKERNTVPFTFNKPQADYWPKQTKRDIILKAGQLGFTSMIGADFLVDCITNPGTVSIVVAHEEFITQRLLARVKFYESTIPDELKPVLHHKSAYELTWPEINSTFYIGSARAYIFGRGEHITNFHASEIAFWPDPEKIMNAVTQRAERIVLESTPFGEGTYYHEVVKEALSGNSVWTLHFYEWWWGVDNRLSHDSQMALPKDRITPLEYTEEEQQLADKHNLDEKQTRWRRAKIGELKESFWQEHPEDTETCFFLSSEMVFDKDTLDEMIKKCYPAPFSYQGTDVWYPPEAGHQYVISVDPTVGREKKAAAVVWSFRDVNPIHCATLHGLYEPLVLAGKIKELGLYYNKALLVVESNNPGVAVLTELRNYTNLYYRRNIMTGAEMNQLGWLTTETTKAYMIKEFHRALPTMITHDIRLVREARNIRYFGLKAISTGDDDIFMAAAIGLAIRETVPNKKRGLIGTSGFRW